MLQISWALLISDKLGCVLVVEVICPCLPHRKSCNCNISPCGASSGKNTMDTKYLNKIIFDFTQDSLYVSQLHLFVAGPYPNHDPCPKRTNSYHITSQMSHHHGGEPERAMHC